MDDASFLAGSSRVSTATKGMGDTLVSTDAKIARSSGDLAAVAKKSADAQVAAMLKVREASKLRISALSGTVAAGAGAAAGSLQAERASAATVVLEREQAKLARSYGVTTLATTRFGGASNKAGKDLNEVVRGGLAGSGALSSVGRSLAFASSGFIAFAVGSQLIAKSVTSAADLAKAQDSLGVAIKHTGGNVQKLEPIYDATAKAAAKFGVTQTDATTGLARATVLTGSAVKAQRAFQEALLISKATGKDFNAVLLAASKGQDGITTSLRRYIPLISTGTNAQKQYNLVLARFGGQAAANTTATEKLRASFSNALATIGTALLPTFDKLATSLANWLTKMNESGKLQKDVASGMDLIKTATTPLIKGIQELSSAVGGLSKAWGYLKKVQSGGGVSGFFAGQIPGALNFAKNSLQQELFPVQSIISAFSGHTSPPPPPVSLGLRLPVPGGGTLPFAPTFGRGQGGTPGPFGNAQPIPVFKSFQDTIGNQLAQARAALTKSTADDVAAAKAEIAQIKKEIAAGHLQGPSLVQALQAQASAVATIQSAEAAAVQKQTAKIEAQIDPIRLEVSLSRAQALGQSTLPALRALRAAAQRVIDSGNATLAQQKEAYDQITSLNQAIKSATQTSIKEFAEPLKLQIALAREQAFGQSTTATLQAMKKAALKALHSGKYTGQALIDLYNEIASLNQQLSSSATAGLGKFKQLNLDKVTSGLNLTPAEKKLLQARLSQVGPGGTVPGDGVGAFGVVVGKDGKVKGAKVPHTGPRDTRPVTDATIGRLITHLDRIAKRPIQVTVDLDGRAIATSMTNYQQRHKRRNSSQRRGPHAGGGG
jgi:hypothetical protein